MIGQIFEADVLQWPYGFRAGVDAKMALRQTHFGIADRDARELFDASPPASRKVAAPSAYELPTSEANNRHSQPTKRLA